jgi:hypothetical protein
MGVWSGSSKGHFEASRKEAIKILDEIEKRAAFVLQKEDKKFTKTK